jgi:cytochrome c oxidase assembly factor CtaG
MIAGWPMRVAVSAVAFAAAPALAHAPEPVAPQELWRQWSLDPLVLVPLVAASVLYGLGYWRLTARLSRPPTALRAHHAAAFAAGIVLMVLALLSPLEALTGTLLSAHMVQHVIIVTAAPLLLVLGRPEIPWLWSLPAGWRRALARGSGWRAALALGIVLSRPVPAAILHAFVLWIWHAPALFDAALERDWLHWLEHLCFFGTALLFWRGIVRASRQRETAAASVAACLLTVVQGGFLGALLTFAGRPLFTADAAAMQEWGLTPLDDQQLAGVIMWVPMGAVYMIAGLAAGARLLSPPAAPLRRAPSSIAP